MQLKVVRLDRTAELPKYLKKTDAAIDLRSNETCILSPVSDKFLFEVRVIPTGIAIEIPEGYFGSIRDRSGIAAKNGIHTMAGVIDSGYRGEVKIVMVNLSREPFTIRQGDRIAQLLIQPVIQPEIVEVLELSDSDRGTTGFGATGIQ